MVTPKSTIMPSLMFSGRAEEAMRFYVSLFDQSEVLSVRRYGPNEAGADGECDTRHVHAERPDILVHRQQR